MQDIGTSPSGKAAGFGPAISEVRILPSQIYRAGWLFFIIRKDENLPSKAWRGSSGFALC